MAYTLMCIMDAVIATCLLTNAQVVGIPESGVTRETLKESFKPYGKVLFVDFSIGKNEALLR